MMSGSREHPLKVDDFLGRPFHFNRRLRVSDGISIWYTHGFEVETRDGKTAPVVLPIPNYYKSELHRFPNATFSYFERMATVNIDEATSTEKRLNEIIDELRKQPGLEKVVFVVESCRVESMFEVERVMKEVLRHTEFTSPNLGKEEPYLKYAFILTVAAWGAPEAIEADIVNKLRAVVREIQPLVL